MDSWQNLPRAAFDLETTGRNPLEARIVTATVMVVAGDGSLTDHHEWLVDPGIPIPDEAAEIHGVTTERARAEGMPAGVAVQELSTLLTRLFAAGLPVLAFNASYDFTVLAAEGERYAVPTPVPVSVIDPYIMDKQADRFRRGKRTLSAMCEHYGIELTDAHTSAADVWATLRVAAELATRFPLLCQPAAQLHELQRGWAQNQASSFQEYLRRSNPDAVVDGSWPLRDS